jgi:murein DD-endopeptidase MepM/ murein hydrolase activator NlpD
VFDNAAGSHEQNNAGVSVHLILVSDRLATAKSITLSSRHLVLAVAVLFSAVLGMSSLFSYLTVRYAVEWRLPVLQDIVRTVNAEDARRSAEVARENINAMAVKLGEMQAQLIHLGTLGERLAGAAGVKIQETMPTMKQPAGGRGGPLVQPQTMSPEDLQSAVDSLAQALEWQADSMSLIESQMLDERIRNNQLPTSLPVAAAWNASTYGWRIDPFTGQRAMHEGVDFPAPPGEKIRAAAAGVVVASESHPEYGKLVEVDHGQGLTTRYAHASRITVKEGEFVKRGQVIAEVGNTGRSTGPHLHFEVRMHGIAQNPDRFLRLASGQSPRNTPVAFR